jgi:hypothetical protein
MAADAEVNDPGAPEASTSGPGQKPSRKRPVRKQYLRDAAKEAIAAVYPGGVPANEPPNLICEKVAKRMKESGFKSVSNDTILRAAGRK